MLVDSEESSHINSEPAVVVLIKLKTLHSRDA